MAGLFSYFGASGQYNKQVAFWNWFQKNEDQLFKMESSRGEIFNELDKEIHKVCQDLAFEFGPVDDNGKREFIIGADGIRSAFPVVESLYAGAPKLERWEFRKYRPRRGGLEEVKYAGKSIKEKDVSYQLVQEGKEIGVRIFFEGYNKAEEEIYEQIGSLFLHYALGEFDAVAKVGWIEFLPRTSKYYSEARLLSELPGDFDAHFIYKETSWKVTQKTYEGFPLVLRYPEQLHYDDIARLFTKLVIMTHKLSDVMSNGLPAAEYAAGLFDFDQYIVKYLRSRKQGITVLVETFGGRRTYYCYAVESFSPDTMKKDVEAKYPSYNLEWEEKKDSDASFIRRYAKDWFGG